MVHKLKIKYTVRQSSLNGHSQVGSSTDSQLDKTLLKGCYIKLSNKHCTVDSHKSKYPRDRHLVSEIVGCYENDLVINFVSLVSVQNCAFVVANVTKNLVFATRISQLVTRICHLATENFCLVVSWHQHKKVNFGSCLSVFCLSKMVSSFLKRVDCTIVENQVIYGKIQSSKYFC